MTERLFVDIHVIETLPPSCVNRDDLGSPKTACYGGVTRARVSSQAWKRAIRMEFEAMGEEIGQRTKRLSNLLTEQIRMLAPDTQNGQELAEKLLHEVNLKVKKDHTLSTLFFISPAQLRALAQVIVEYGVPEEPKKPSDKASDEKKAAYQEEKDEYETYKAKRDAAIRENPSLDVALFGRMLAENKELNCDACAQVAHALSTHEIHNEFDYFTAVDDVAPDSGAGYLDTMEFNSSTMYRYATVNALELQKYLGEQTPHAICAFVKAFILSMPAGKQNSYANRVRPDAVYVTVRKDQPVNMAGAFECPVQAGKDGYVEASVQRLTAYAKETLNYCDEPALELTVGRGMESLAEPGKLPVLLDTLEKDLTARLEGKEVK